jgi:uncharacterized protein with PIN domain
VILRGRMGARHERRGLVECLEIEFLQRDHVVIELAQEASLRLARGRLSARPTRGTFASYALAKTCRNPLLCKDPDVARTGVTAAIAASPA